MTKRQLSMFQGGDDLPLFSGTPQPVKDSTFTPKDEPQQLTLSGCTFCHGTGWVAYKMMERDRVIRSGYMNCPRCNLDGSIPEPGKD